jgi:hypothetical protein
MNILVYHIRKLELRSAQSTLNIPTVTSQLTTWRRKAHSDDPVFRSWPQDWIISNASIVLLAHAKPRDFATPNNITKFLYEDEDWHDSWADEIYTIISDYDNTHSSKLKGQQRTALASSAIEEIVHSLGPESEGEPEISIQGNVDQEDHNGGGGELTMDRKFLTNLKTKFTLFMEHQCGNTNHHMTSCSIR